MGLWMIQSVKKELAKDMSFGEICAMAEKENISSIVDCNDESFLAPKSMTEAVRDFCRKTSQQVPETIGELAAVIYNSLAKCYADTLNKLTSRYTKRKVSAGPTEATAIGNLTVQMLSDGVFKNLAEARGCIRKSFDIKMYSEL